MELLNQHLAHLIAGKNGEYDINLMLIPTIFAAHDDYFSIVRDNIYRVYLANCMPVAMCSHSQV